jgi:hypothetical protein
MDPIEDTGHVFSDFKELSLDQTNQEINIPIYNWQPITEDFLFACKGWCMLQSSGR